MKKWIIRLLIVGVVVLLAALGILFFKLNAIVKTSVETIGSQLTKTEVKLGSASILPFTGGGELMALSVGNPAGYKSPTAIKVGGINVSVALGTILKDTVEIKSVKIRAPEITVEGGLFNNNLKEIQKNLHSPATASSGAGGSSSGKAGKKFYIKDLVVTDGKIVFLIDGAQGKIPPLPLNIHLTNVGGEGSGVDAAELTRQVLQPILAEIITAALNNSSALTKDMGGIGGKAGEEVKKIGDSLKKIFGK